MIDFSVSGSVLLCAVHELFAHKGRFFSADSVGAQEVGEEKDAEHNEDDEEFDEYDSPKRLTQRHAAKAVGIEMIGARKEIGRGHARILFRSATKLHNVERSRKGITQFFRFHFRDMVTSAKPELRK